MTNSINRILDNSSTTSATTNLNPVKPAQQLAFEYKGGHQRIADSFKKDSEPVISNIQEGIVFYLINNGNPIQYSILSHQSTKLLEGICIKVFCNTLDDSCKTNPQRLYAEEIQNKNLTITTQEKENIKNMCLSACAVLDTFAPKDSERGVPKPGDRVILHYNNDALSITGEPIAGTYEIIKADNSYFAAEDEFFEFIKPSITTQISNILKETANNIASAIGYPNSEQQQGSVSQQQLSHIVPIKQSDNPWGSVDIIAGKKVSSIGCLMTCYTMANNGLNNQNLTPLDVLNQIKPLGAFDSSGILNNDIITRKLSLKYIFGPAGNTNSIKNFIDSCILEGALSILHVDYTTGRGSDRTVGLDNIGDHFILCIKKDENGNYICNDPATGSSLILNKDNLTGPARFRGSNATYKVVAVRKVFRG